VETPTRAVRVTTAALLGVCSEGRKRSVPEKKKKHTKDSNNQAFLPAILKNVAEEQSLSRTRLYLRRPTLLFHH
jgi:hypothetical protein